MITKQWELKNKAHTPLAIEEFNKAIFITMIAPLVYQAAKMISRESWHQHGEGRKKCLEHVRRFLVQSNIQINWNNVLFRPPFSLFPLLQCSRSVLFPKIFLPSVGEPQENQIMFDIQICRLSTEIKNKKGTVEIVEIYRFRFSSFPFLNNRHIFEFAKNPPPPFFSDQCHQ